MADNKNKNTQAEDKKEDKKYARAPRSTDKYVTAKIPPLKKKTHKDTTALKEKTAEEIKAKAEPVKATTKAEPAKATTKAEPAKATTKAEPAKAATKPEPAKAATKPEPAKAEAKAEPAKAEAKAEETAVAVAKTIGKTTETAKETVQTAEEKTAKKEDKLEDVKKEFKAKAKTSQSFDFKVFRKKTYYPIVVMLVICLVSGLLLGGVNLLTAPVIERSNQELLQQTLQTLLPAADEFETLEVEDMPEDILAVFKAKNDEGYVIHSQSRGYSSKVPVLVAFGKDGTVACVKFLENSETVGLGKEIETSKIFAEQFENLEAAEISNSAINGVAGATLSTNAAVGAVNKAIGFYNSVYGEAEVYMMDTATLQSLVPEASAFTQLDVKGLGILAAYRADNGVYVVVAAGDSSIGGQLPVAVAFDENAIITAIWLDTSKETQGYGKHIGDDEDYKAQFIGQESAEDIDTIAGSTITTTAVNTAVNKAAEALSAVRKAPELAGGGTIAPPTTPEAFELSEDAIKQLAPNANSWVKIDLAGENVLAAYRTDDGLHIIVINGHGVGDIPVAAALDDSGTVTALWMDTSNESDGFGKDFAENEDFTSQFIGKTSVDDVDIVTGVTLTSQGIKDAVAAAISLLPQAQQAGEVAA